MESSNFVMALITTFIGAAILLGVGIQVLASVQESTDCSILPGGGTVSGHTTASNATGWSLTCFKNNTSIQNGYALLLVIMIVIAAVAILAVVRLL